MFKSRGDAEKRNNLTTARSCEALSKHLGNNGSTGGGQLNRACAGGENTG